MNDNWNPLFAEVVEAVTYKPGFELLLCFDATPGGGRWYFQVECKNSVCAITGEIRTDRGGKAYLSPYATRSELAQIAFGLFKAYEEHEAREFFRYAGKQVFGPHLDVLALHGIADITDARIEARA